MKNRLLNATQNRLMVPLIVGLFLGGTLPIQAEVTLRETLRLGDPKPGALVDKLTPKFVWTDKKNARRYLLVVGTTIKEVTISNLHINKIANTGDVDTITASLEARENELKANQKYFWQVYVLNEQGQPIEEAVNGPLSFEIRLAPSNTPNGELPDASEENDEPLFDKWARKGFKLGRTVADAQQRDDKDPSKPGGKPAALSLLASRGTRSAYRADFGLVWQKTDENGFPIPIRNWGNPGKAEWFFQSSIEGELARSEAEAADALRTRLTLERFAPGPFGLDNSQMLLSLKHEASQSFDTQKLGLEALFTPTKLKWGVGMYRPLFGNLRYRLQPTFGLEGGSTLRGGRSVEDDYFRLLWRMRADLRFDRFLGAKYGKLFVDNSYYHLPLQNGRDNFNYLIAGFEYPLNDNVSLGLTYKRGRAAPLFADDIRTFGAEVGLKF